MKEVIKFFSAILKPPKITTGIHQDVSDLLSPNVQKPMDEHKVAKITEANFWLQRETAQHTLNLTYGAMIVSTAAIIISFISLLVAILK